MTPLVSVIVPIYNVEPYLPQCLDSIAAQTYANLEVLLVDDGSTDACGAICDEYAAANSRFRVIHKENGGLVSARKAGLKQASGLYATYVDSDDFIGADLMERCVKAMEDSGADILVHGYVKDGETERHVKTTPLEPGLYEGERLDALRKQMLSMQDTDYFTFGIEPSVWSKMFRRSLLEKHQMCVPDEITIGEDVAFTYPFLAECQKAVIDNDITGYYYRVTPVSMTRSLNPAYFRKISALYRYLKESLPENTDADYRAQTEDYRFYMIVTKTEEIRNRAGLSEAEQIAYLDEAAKDADILDDLEKTAESRFRGEALKRLKYIQNRNWKALYRSYRLEPLKERIHATFFS